MIRLFSRIRWERNFYLDVFVFSSVIGCGDAAPYRCSIYDRFGCRYTKLCYYYAGWSFNGGFLYCFYACYGNEYRTDSKTQRKLCCADQRTNF